MVASVKVRLDAVDNLLERSYPLLNTLSSSAHFISSGKLQYSKHKEVVDELTTWVMQNSGILPNWVIDPVARLSSRVTDWVYSQGKNATPQNFATDEADSFAEVNSTLHKYKSQLLEELDDSEERLKTAVAKELRSPWASGLFYLVAALLVLAALAAITNVISPWLLPLIVIGGVIFLSVIGLLQLRQDDRLSEKGFGELMRVAIGSLPLLLKRRGELD